MTNRSWQLTVTIGRRRVIVIDVVSGPTPVALSPATEFTSSPDTVTQKAKTPTCLECGKTLEGRGQTKFCSRACSNLHSLKKRQGVTVTRVTPAASTPWKPSVTIAAGEGVRKGSVTL